jgi:hypothetical protein
MCVPDVKQQEKKRRALLYSYCLSYQINFAVSIVISLTALINGRDRMQNLKKEAIYF